MNPIAVESTTVITVAYDADRKLLQLQFQDQSNHQYLEVPAEVYEALSGDSSKDHSFNRVIGRRVAHVQA